MSICIDLCMSRLQSQIVCHDNRIETTVYCLYVGVVRLGNFTSLLAWWNAIFNHLSDEHS